MLKNHLINSIIFIAILVALSSCSTTKQVQKSETKQVVEQPSPLHNLYKPEIQSIIFSGDFNLKSNFGNFNGTFRFCSSRKDSLLVEIFGPFNINIAKIIAYKSNFAICNLWNGTYYSSTVDSINNQYPIFSFSISNILSLLIAEPIYSDKYYHFKNNDTINNIFQYHSIIHSNFIDIIDISNNYIINRNIINSNVQLKINYNNYISISNNFLPSKISLKEDNNQININITNIKFEKINTDFSNDFKIPSNLKRVNKIQELYK